MEDGPVQFTKRQLQRIFFAPRFWAVIIAVGVVLGMAGPFGTFEDLPLLPRIAYWLAIAVSTFFVGMTTIFLVESLFWPGRRLGLLGDALAGLVAGIPITAIVTAINAQLFGAPFSWQQYAYCTAIAVAVSAVGHLIVPEKAAQTDSEELAGEASGVSAGTPPILERLPRHLRGRLLYMSMQDHYVDVHTEKGNALVLMRLADAIREAGGTAGLQVHRSHWVALDAVAGNRRDQGRLFLTMADGASLPVSRTSMPAVREAGLV